MNGVDLGLLASPANAGAVVWAAFLQANGATKAVDLEAAFSPEPVQEKAQEASDPGRLKLVLEILAGLCDGQNTQMQDYLQDQPDNIRSIDLVAATGNIMGLMYGSVSAASIDLVTELVNALIEMVQGNESNQVVVFDHKVVDYTNHILRTREFPGCSDAQIYGLRRSLGIFLTDMIEENTASQHTKLIANSIALDDLFAPPWIAKAGCGGFETMSEAYESLNGHGGSGMEPEEEELVLSVGFLFYHLLCRCRDLRPQRQLPTDAEDSLAMAYFREHTMSIELAKGDTLQRVYFAVEDAEILRKSVKERLKWEVDRSTPANKHRDFMKWAHEVCADIRYQRSVQSYPLCRALVSNWGLLNLAVMLLSYVINLVILLGWAAPEQFDENYQFSVATGHFLQVTSAGVKSLEFILGVIGIVLCAALFASFLLANRPTTPAWLKAARRVLRRQSALSSLPEGAEGGEYLGVSLLGPSCLYYGSLVALALLGTCVNSAFFAFHTLHIASQNQLLIRVIQAVTQNGRSILWVCFLGLIFFYIYALLGFLFLRNVFLGNSLYCRSMWECFISTIRNGLMFGMADNFDIPESDPRNSFNFYGWKTIFDLSFFAIIVTIGLNVIFGIIIDTFSELREAKSAIEDDMNSCCFICNLQAFEFEHHGKGFDEHVKQEHSMWAYLFFFILLADTPPNDMTSLQLFTYDAVSSECPGTKFLPMGRALTLSQWEEDNADLKLQQVADQVALLLARLEDQDAEKDRLSQIHSRAAKKAARRDQGKSFWGRRKTDVVAPKRRPHAAYGPFPAPASAL